MANNKVVAIVGIAGAGKSWSLKYLKNQKKWMYINCETNKPLPFVNNFVERTVITPVQALQALKEGITNEKCEGIIIDTFTAFTDLLETTSKRSLDGYQIWDNYKDTIMSLFQDYFARANKPIILLAHVAQSTDARGRPVMKIPVKGALKDRSIESFFTNIIYADALDVMELDEYSNDYLTITKEEEEIGIKHVFQTHKTGTSTGLNIRTIENLFTKEETFIDNNIQHVLDKIDLLYSNQGQ